MKGRQEKAGKAQTVLPHVQSLPPVTRAEKVQGILRSVQEKVAGLIDNEEVKVSVLKVPYVNSPKDESKELAFRIKAVQETREKMRSRLQQITLQERELKLKQRHGQDNSQSKQRSLSPLGVRAKSKLTEEDIALLRRLKKEHRQFEKSLEEKTAEYNQKAEQLKKEQNQLKQRQKKEMTQARCKEITARLQNISKQQTQRAKVFEQEKKKIIQLKMKRKLFEEWEERQKQAQKTQMQKKIAAMQQRLQKNKEIDLANIQQHEQRYQDIKAQQKAERERKRQQLQQLSRQRNQDKFQRSKFYTLAVNQTRQRKEEEGEKQRQRVELVEAARQYAQQVKRQYAPRLKTHSSQQQKAHEKPQGLTFEEMKEVGNSYFEQMRKKLKKPAKNNNSSVTSSHTTTPTPLNTQSTKYRDYLSERRITKPPPTKRDKMNLTGDSRIVNRGLRLGLEEACRLAGGEQRAEGLERLRLFASRLEVQRGTEDFQLLDKIAAKLHILETLSQRD